MQTEHLRLAITFDVVGDNLVAGAYGNHVCSGFFGGFSVGSVLKGAVAPDGTFGLQSTPGLPGITLEITGKAPATAGGSWPGTYTASFGSSQGIATSCVEMLSGNFTATSFPLVSGVYAGTASLTAGLGGEPVTSTMSLQMMLQQGGTASTPRGSVTSNTVLTGSIKVQGSPCFSSGTRTGTTLSGVLGNEVHAAFTMDDGALLEVIGTLTDPSESKIATNLVIVHGGKCGGDVVPVGYRLAELDRQP